jgi:hypothetical protein
VSWSVHQRASPIAGETRRKEPAWYNVRDPGPIPQSWCAGCRRQSKTDAPSRWTAPRTETGNAADRAATAGKTHVEPGTPSPPEGASSPRRRGALRSRRFLRGVGCGWRFETATSTNYRQTICFETVASSIPGCGFNAG